MGGNQEVFVMNADDSNRVNLTNTAMNAEYSPALSPDGTRIAFTFSAPGGKQQVFVMNADGSSPVNLTNNDDETFGPHWSPDARRITSSSNRAGDFDAWVMNADGSNPVNLTGGVTNNAGALLTSRPPAPA